MTKNEPPAEISCEELSEWLANGPEPRPVLVDVREKWEWDLVHLDGSVHKPMGGLPRNHADLDPEAPTVVLCHHGIRSLNSTLFLRSVGFQNVRSLAGGIDRWATAVARDLKRY